MGWNDFVSDVGGGLSNFATMGTYNTKGNGLLQGGSLKDYANNSTFGLAGKLADRNKIPVPENMQRPEWMLGDNGVLRKDLQLGSTMPKSFDQSQTVLNKLQADAMAKGPSQPAQYLQEANARNTANAMSQADALGASQMASAQNGLAMRGGLDSGARERMARSFGTDTMMNKQRVLNDSAGNNLNILAKDEDQKRSTLQALPASLLAQAGMAQSNKQFDISNTLGTFGNKYNQDMSIYGGNQAAREQAMLANKNSGMLGLGFLGL